MELFDIFKKKKQPENKGPMYLYSDQELVEFDAYVEKCLGYYDFVFHEIASPDIHLDVITIPPTEEHPFHKLVTMGAGAYEMNVPEQLKEQGFGHAEYVIFLPSDWNINSGDEKDYWPTRTLKMMGRLPIYEDSWLGFGHTIQADEDGSSYAENTGFNCTMLVSAVNFNGERMRLKLSSGKIINFYQLIPIYPEELAYKQANHAEALLDLLLEQEGFPVVDIHRKSVIR